MATNRIVRNDLVPGAEDGARLVEQPDLGRGLVGDGAVGADVEDLALKEGEGLVSFGDGGMRQPPVVAEVGEEANDVIAAEVQRVAEVVEEDELSAPVGEAFDAVRREAKPACGEAELVEGFGPLRRAAGQRGIRRGKLLLAQAMTGSWRCTHAEVGCQRPSRPGKGSTGKSASGNGIAAYGRRKGVLTRGHFVLDGCANASVACDGGPVIPCAGQHPLRKRANTPARAQGIALLS